MHICICVYRSVHTSHMYYIPTSPLPFQHLTRIRIHPLRLNKLYGIKFGSFPACFQFILQHLQFELYIFSVSVFPFPAICLTILDSQENKFVNSGQLISPSARKMFASPLLVRLRSLLPILTITSFFFFSSFHSLRCGDRNTLEYTYTKQHPLFFILFFFRTKYIYVCSLHYTRT